MGLKLQIHYPLSPAQSQRQIWFNFISPFPATFDAYGEATFWWIKPNKSHVTYWTSPGIHQTFIIDEPRWRTSWISNILIKNTTTFWCSSWEHNNIPLVTLQWLFEPKNSINRDHRLIITCTIAKHTRKQLKFVWRSCNSIDHHWRLFLPSL
jgi:hypothetical protein